MNEWEHLGRPRRYNDPYHNHFVEVSTGDVYIETVNIGDYFYLDAKSLYEHLKKVFEDEK